MAGNSLRAALMKFFNYLEEYEKRKCSVSREIYLCIRAYLNILKK